jgi:putative ABC transport system permease protein
VWFGRAAGRLARRAPHLAAAAAHGEIAASVEAACRDARQRGVVAAVWTGVSECAAVAMAAARPERTRISAKRRALAPEGRFRMLRTLPQDLRSASRALVGAKLTTITAIVTLALGIGVNTAVFSVLDSVLFRPVPYRDADRLVSLQNFEPTKGFSYFGFPVPLLKRWREQTDLFIGVEAMGRASLVFNSTDGAELLNGATVTPGLFALLGVDAARGRTFAADEGRGGSDRVVIISDRLWRNHFGGAVDATGRTLTLNGETCRVIGVMPSGFQYPSGLTDIWLPYDASAPTTNPVVPPGPLEPIAKLAPGLAFERAATETEARGNRLSRAAGLPGETITAQLGRPAEVWDTKTVRSLAALGGAVAFLLLMVAANLANLSLGRSLARARDFAVRSALGASRADIVRETLIENLLVGTAGVVAGLGVAAALLRATVSALPDAFVAATANVIDLDARALWFSAAAGLFATVLFGLPPAIMAGRRNVVDGLRADSRSTTGSRSARQWRGALVVSEVTLSVVLLVGAALMARSLMKLQSEPRGFDSDGLISMTVALPAPAYTARESRAALIETLSNTLRVQPGVHGVTTGGVPSTLDGVNAGTLEFGHAAPAADEGMSIVPAREVPAGYFSALRLPILDGHALTTDDPADAVVVSEAFAKKYWGTSSAVGGRFRFASGPGGGPSSPWRTVVGVAANVRALSDARDTGQAIYYLDGHASGMLTATRPSSTIAGYVTFVVRATNPAEFVRPMGSLVHQADARLVVWKTDLVDHLYADAFARPRVLLLAMSTFAAFGVLLVAAGLYGVLSHLVALRTREIGIRAALGATRAQIARIVVGQGVMLTGVGLVAGVLLAMPLVRAMRALLYDVEPTDPLSLAAVAGVLLVAAVAATWRPARRAARVDPMSLLRE